MLGVLLVAAVSPTRPSKLTYAAGDWAFLGLLFFLALSGFALEALRIAIDRPGFEVWAPLGYAVGNGLHAAGLGAGTAETLRHVTWWVHGIVALSFVAAIPRHQGAAHAGRPGRRVGARRGGQEHACRPSRRPATRRSPTSCRGT